MSPAPEAKLKTVRYDGGSVRATQAALVKLVGESAEGGGGGGWGPAPGFRRPYGYRNRSNAAAGIPLRLTFADGETWTYRVSGTVKAFIDRVVRPQRGDEVQSITSPRGAEVDQELVLDLDPDPAA